MLEKALIITAEAYDSKISNPNEEIMSALNTVLAAMDSGEILVNIKINSAWQVNEAAKKAILLMFKFFQCNSNYGNLFSSGAFACYDKVPLKFQNWKEEDFAKAGIRCVPGAIARYTSFIGRNTILMPSFVNVGAHIGDGTLVDTWSTIGSCAHIGANCHISGGVGIGGVLEPIQANPVIIEDNCLIGARSEIVEGVIVEQGCVIGMGVFIGASTKIISRETGEVFYGRVPANSVVASGSYKTSNDLNVNCAVIVKMVDQSTMDKTQRNELLRV